MSSKDDDCYFCDDTDCCDWACCSCYGRSSVEAKTTGTFICCCFCPQGESCCSSDANDAGTGNARKTTTTTTTNKNISLASKEKQQTALRLYELRLKLRPILINWVESKPHQPLSEETQQMMTRLLVLGKSLQDLNPELSGGKHIIHVMCERNDLIQLKDYAKIVGPAWWNLLKETPMHKTGALNYQNKQEKQQQQQQKHTTATTPTTTTVSPAQNNNNLLLDNNNNNRPSNNNKRPPPLNFTDLNYDEHHNNNNNKNGPMAAINPLSGSMMLVINGAPLSPLSSGKTVLLPQDLATDPEVRAFVAVHHHHDHKNNNNNGKHPMKKSSSNKKNNSNNNNVSAFDLPPSVEGLTVEESIGHGTSSDDDEHNIFVKNNNTNEEQAKQDQQNVHQKLCVKCKGSGREACQTCSGFAQTLIEEKNGWFMSVFCCSKVRREEPGCKTCANWGAIQCSVCSGSGLFTAE